MKGCIITIAMPAIEVELRSFVSDDAFGTLLDFFKAHASFKDEDEQETWYLDVPEDVRIQRNKSYSKIWSKKGNIHDEAREETEARFPAEDFDKLASMAAMLGIGVKIKWFRKRIEFDWDGVSVCLDDTKGYGKILELEMVVPPESKDQALVELRSRFGSLNISITPRSEFEQAFAFYEKNWRTLTGAD
jgi:adenylate cyclase class IV